NKDIGGIVAAWAGALDPDVLQDRQDRSVNIGQPGRKIYVLLRFRRTGARTAGGCGIHGENSPFDYGVQSILGHAQRKSGNTAAHKQAQPAHDSSSTIIAAAATGMMAQSPAGGAGTRRWLP